MTYIEIKKILNSIKDPALKLEFVMDLGRTLKTVPKDAVCHEILGCNSHVEICTSDGNLYGLADSFLVAGIVAIFLAMVEGKTITEIKTMDLKSEFLSLDLQLGISRIGGVNSMISFLQNL